MSELQLAQIREVTLGVESHGILTSFVHLDYATPGSKLGGAGQGFGGYALNGEYAARWIRGVLDAVGVEEWSKLPGHMVWVDAEPTKVHAITGLVTGKTFDVRDAAQWPQKEIRT